MKKNVYLSLAISSALACGSAYAGDEKTEAHVEKHVEKHVQAEKVDRSAHASEMKNKKQSSQNQMSSEVQKATSGWAKDQRDLVQEMISKYGEPSGVMPSRVVWDEPSSPWSEIIVYRDAVDHDFPVEHQDYLEQSVYYQVPADKMDELAQYDGSVTVFLTEGRLAARCDKEGANILALNLAHDIITGEKNVQQARDAYASAIKQMKQGDKVAIMQELNFEPMTAEKAAMTDETVVSL